MPKKWLYAAKEKIEDETAYYIYYITQNALKNQTKYNFNQIYYLFNN